MRFSNRDIQQFADWSGDHNPLHVDPAAARRTVFGQTVVHGMLSAIRALNAPLLSRAEGVRALDIEFRSAVFPETSCTLVATPDADGTGTAIMSGDAQLVAIHVNRGGAAERVPDVSWMAKATSEAMRRPHPATLDADDMREGREITARYETGTIPEGYTAADGLLPVQARVLGLCSYLVGMELPGLRSLFTRLSLTFTDNRKDSPVLLYRAHVVRFDPHFRILDVRLDVATSDGAPVACGDVRAYVRLSPIVTRPEFFAAHLSPESKRLAGQVVLVCGGSRGLGAELTAALAMAGCHVYASYHRDRDAARELAAAIEHAGARIELVEGDAGDVDWCAQTLRTITATRGRLDAVVLNACAPPAAMRLAANSARAFTDYIEQNLRLAQAPLAVFLPAISDRGGSIVCVSSSFVADPPAGFGHYVALKQAVEATVQTAVRESAGARGLIARPPRLQTSWNDTPTGVPGTIPASHAAVHIVNRLAAGIGKRETALVSDFPEIKAVQVARGPDAGPDITIGLAASFTADPILDGLNFWLSELGVRGSIDVAPYGQILQTLLNPAAAASKAPRVQVVLLRVRDWLRELPDEQRSSPEFVAGYLNDVAADFERAMRTHRAQSAAETLLVFCPSAAPGKEEADVEASLAARLNGLPGLTVIHAQDHHAAYGVSSDSIADAVREHIAHIPYQSAYFHTLATVVMRHVYRKLAPARKLVVVDCDNTLWRGVVGEVGAEGVAFDEAHAALHRTLTRLHTSGVLVALCSKNEEADVWRVFESRPDFGLSRDVIVAATINWLPKSENLKALAARLNLGLDSLVFIDDNPVECAEVRAGCPDVLTLEWPLEPARAQMLLQHTWELDPRSATAEDQRRTELYREEFRRQEAQAQTLTFRDFIASLELQVDIAPLAPADLKRSSQLTLRTNQFNFTTRRRDEGELQALAAAGTHEIRTVKVRDRFGDYGLVGLIIATVDGDALWADTFLLSCRVLGRGVEHQMAAELGRIAEAHGASRVLMRVDPTKRNTPARAFLETIVPDDYLRRHDGVVEAELPAAFTSAIVFEPADQAPPPVTDDVAASKAPRPADASRLRARETQIVRTAFELSSAERLARAIDGSSVETKPAGPGFSPAVNLADTSAYVYQAFASALGVPEGRVREIDTLEALGCDSFKIVEITVNLLEKFPRLPSTLLFEHRSVSEIASRIAELSSGTPRPAPAASRASGLRREEAQGRDVAVVGMHLRCAGAQSPGELWDLLSTGRIAVRQVPPDRPYFLGTLTDDRPHFAGLLEEVDRFDAELFGITPREAELMDPQLRLFLEVAWAALEDAGALGEALEINTGVFAGVMYGDYAYRANLVARHGENPFKSWEGFSLANRLSQIFGFRGPSLAVDTACSSSATAVHLACRALNAGDCSVAIAGGVNLILDPDRFVQLGRLGILSPSGRCLAFGAEADGTILGEGAGVVVLRPLSDALRRGDRIYGVIKATGVSTGSGTVGFTAPNPLAQAEAIRRAIRYAGIDPRTVSCVETHGTGTTLGDPIEVRGLTLAYTDHELWDPAVQGAQSCAIGSIKPNIGHLEAGAGVLGLIKALLQVSRGMLLPSVTSEEPNPQIPFSSTPFAVQRALSPWTRPVLQMNGTSGPVPRRAAINSFGVGGANAHIIVEEPPASEVRSSAAERTAHILAVSARSDDSLKRRLTGVTHLLEEQTDASIADVCFSANTGRRHLDRRVAVTARSREEMIDALRQIASGQEPAGSLQGTVSRSAPPTRLAFLFTGQGSQYAGMGRALYETQPVFRQALDECFDRFQAQMGRSLRAVMFAADGTPDAENLNQTGCTQPALFAIEYALSQMWCSWGIRPDAVMGHSVGEISAMCVAGGISLDDAVRLIAARGSLMQALPSGGAMTSVMAPESRVVEALAGYDDRVAIGAVNGPAQIVISGEAAAVEEIAARLRADGVKTRSLVVSHAFHSALMRPMLASYEQVVRTIRFSRPEIPLVSGVHGRVAGDEILQPEYWLRNVADAVRFTDGMRTMEALNVNAFLEVGPQPVLIGMGRQCLTESDAEPQWLTSIRKDADPWPQLLSSIGSLYVTGVDVDWACFDSAYVRRRVSLPPYPFARKRHWIGAVPTTTIIAGSDASERSTAIETGARAYDISWRKDASREGSREADASGHWLIFGDSAGIGAALSRLLEAKGAECTLVSANDRYAAANPGSVLAGLESAGTSVRGVVYLWGIDGPPEGGRYDPVDGPPEGGRYDPVDGPPEGRRYDPVDGPPEGGRYDPVDGPLEGGRYDPVDGPLEGGRYDPVDGPPEGGRYDSVDGPPEGGTSDPAERAIDEAERAASVMRAVAAPRAAGNPRLWIVTSDAATAGDSRAPFDVSQSALWGLGRTFALEHAAQWGGLIDLSAASGVSFAAEALAREILAVGGDDQIAIRDDGSYVPRLVPRVEAGRTPLSISSDGTYLVTGGLGALGLHVARWLAVNGARRLILTSRRGLDTPDASGSLRELEAAGAAVTVLAADISRPADVDAVLAAASEFPPLLGVFHAAGVDETRTILELTPGDFERVMAAKARGAWLLHERTRTAPLHVFACFSSIASVLGSAGRPAYAAANAFLDALVHERRREGLPALSINWGPWAGGGMATDTALEQYKRVGNRGLDPAQAVAALQTLIETGAVQSAVADIDWPSFRTAYEARRPRPLISELTASPQTVTSASSAIGAPWVERLSSTPVEERVGELARLLRGEVAQTLGFESAADVPLDQTFHDMGMDSLMSADFAQRLQKRVGIRSTALVFEHPYVEALATHLLEKLALTQHRPEAAPVPAVAALGAVETVIAPAASPAVVAPEGDTRPEGYSARIEPEVFEFQMRAWPARRRDWIAPRWRWMFVESARRLGIAPQVWLRRDGGSIVGHNGAIPVQVKVGDGERLSAWLVDTMVLEEYRSQAVGARLMVEAHEDLPFALSLGQTEQMRAIQLRLGWEQVAPLQTAQLLIRPERVLKGKLPGAAAFAAGLGLRAGSAMRDVWRHRFEGDVREVSRFGAEHDALWERMAGDLTCAVRRDASYMNWKYVDQPGQDFLRLEVSNGHGLSGSVICMFREPDEAYKYRRAFIVDLVAPLSDDRAMDGLLQAAVSAASERGADALHCLHINPRLTSALRRGGFRMRQPSRFLLVRPGPIEGRDRDALLNANGWYVTQGDSDIDRPW